MRRDTDTDEHDGGPAGPVGGLRAYLTELGAYPLLTREDEVRLGILVQDGRRAARRLEHGAAPGEVRALEERVAAGRGAARRFIQSNLRLVVSIARHYRSASLTLLDLIQEGNLGLMHAVDRFDPTRGFRFSTYARYWIHQAINKAAAEHGQAVRVPVQVMDLAWRVRRAQSALEIERRGSQSVAQLADEVGLQPKQVAELMGYLREPRSLSEPQGDDDSDELGMTIPDPRSGTPHDELVELLLPSAMRRLLESLDEREREIIRQHFGLDGRPPRTLAEIGASYRLTRERIRQIEARALAKLRNPITREARSALALVAG